MEINFEKIADGFKKNYLNLQNRNLVMEKSSKDDRFVL
jgi:hypothetical protein